jgi:hypothetical protein
VLTLKETHNGNRNPNTNGLVPWKLGQSGNPSGRPRSQSISDRHAHIAEEKLPANIRKTLCLAEQSSTLAATFFKNLACVLVLS